MHSPSTLPHCAGYRQLQPGVVVVVEVEVVEHQHSVVVVVLVVVVVELVGPPPDVVVVLVVVVLVLDVLVLDVLVDGEQLLASRTHSDKLTDQIHLQSPVQLFQEFYQLQNNVELDDEKTGIVIELLEKLGGRSA